MSCVRLHHPISLRVETKGTTRPCSFIKDQVNHDEPDGGGGGGGDGGGSGGDGSDVGGSNYVLYSIVLPT